MKIKGGSLLTFVLVINDPWFHLCYHPHEEKGRQTIVSVMNKTIVNWRGSLKWKEWETPGKGNLLDLSGRKLSSTKSSKNWLCELYDLTMMGSRSNTALFSPPPPSPRSKVWAVMRKQLSPIIYITECHVFSVISYKDSIKLSRFRRSCLRNVICVPKWTNSKYVQRGGFSNCVVANGIVFSWIGRSVVWGIYCAFRLLWNIQASESCVHGYMQIELERKPQTPPITYTRPVAFAFIPLNPDFCSRSRCIPGQVETSSCCRGQCWLIQANYGHSVSWTTDSPRDGPSAQFWPVSKVWNFWKSFLCP